MGYKAVATVAILVNLKSIFGNFTTFCHFHCFYAFSSHISIWPSSLEADPPLVWCGVVSTIDPWHAINCLVRVVGFWLTMLFNYHRGLCLYCLMWILIPTAAITTLRTIICMDFPPPSSTNLYLFSIRHMTLGLSIKWTWRRGKAACDEVNEIFGKCKNSGN